VSQYSRKEVAQRAGVDPDYVDRLVELGILTPGPGDAFSPGDALRARWVQSLERAGVPLEGMAAAVRDGALSFSFMDATAFDRFAGLSDTTFHQLSERTGIPMDLLKVVREAVGFAEPRSEDHVREDELSVVPAIEPQLSTGFRPAVIERWLRAWADSLRRGAETEADWRKTEVEQRLLEGGMTEAQMLEAQADLGSRMAPSPSRPSSPSTTGSRNTPGGRPSSRSWRARWSGPVCTAGCTVRRRSASSTSPGTPG
jgi:DNA-binding transcriptional MerR regulator